MILKSQIQQEYSDIVSQNKISEKVQKEYVCKPIFDPIAEKYTQYDGYLEESDLGFGCGFPFEYIDLKKHSHIADLGCAAGIDSFIMAKRAGLVSGIDITQSLIDRANMIAELHDITNAKFLQGDIENLLFEDESMDFATSNGVFSLLPNLDIAFAEVYRIIKKDGIFCLADITQKTSIPENNYATIKKYTGCINGIRLQSRYIEIAERAGFRNIEIVNERRLNIPSEIVPPESSAFFITIYKMTK